MDCLDNASSRWASRQSTTDDRLHFTERAGIAGITGNTLVSDTTIPIAPRTGHTLDLYTAERTTGQLLLGVNGQRMDRHATYIVAAFAPRASRSA